MPLSDQVPTNSGFHAQSEPQEVLAGVDLSGKTAIVTGGYSGIGTETVRALVSKGARVIVPARDAEKAEKNLAGLENVVIGTMDLARLESVRSFAEEMIGELHQLDLLINNAGIMACPETRVGPGWEAQFGVNHMGHFALTRFLMPLLQKTAGTRVITLSSVAHKVSDMRWDDVQFTQRYSKWKAYGQSKTANALFANALSRRLKEHGGLAFSVHPGGIFTDLQRHLPKDEMVALGWIGDDGELTEATKKNFKTVSRERRRPSGQRRPRRSPPSPESTARTRTSPRPRTPPAGCRRSWA